MEPMTGESLLTNAFEDSHLETWSEPGGEGAPAIDPATILAIIGAVFEGIRMCRNQDAAARQIKRGGGIAYSRIRKALKKEGYPKRKRNEMARRLAGRGRNLDEEQIQMILDDAHDVPEPTPDEGGNGFPVWPVAVLLLLLPSTVQAAGPFRVWPMEEKVAAATDSLWPMPAVQKRDQILAVMIDSCASCRVDKERFITMRKNGWKISNRVDADIRTVDPDRDREILKRYAPATAFPTYIRIRNGREIGRRVGSSTDWQLLAMLQPQHEALRSRKVSRRGGRGKR